MFDNKMTVALKAGLMFMIVHYGQEFFVMVTPVESMVNHGLNNLFRLRIYHGQNHGKP